mmetsp:Transcript_41397/g.119131  ORF Transcript_41397/g.119131 Transcript_41397/m.119131 type:complete len:307 (-) Transcript_41397:322-1242(-)
MGRHFLREGQIQCHGPRHSYLLRVQVRVATNDAACAIVHALPHQGAPQPALLALQPLADRLQRPLGLRGRLRNADDAVVVQGVDVVLEEFGELHDDVLAGACVDLLLQHDVRLNDVKQLRRDVVLAALGPEGDRWPDVGRRDRQVCEDEVLGRIAYRVEAHALDILLPDAPEDGERLVGGHDPLPVLPRSLLFASLGKGNVHHRAVDEEPRLQVAATATELRIVLAISRCSVALCNRVCDGGASLLRPATEHDGLQALLRANHRHRVLHLVVLRVGEEPAAVVADAPQNIVRRLHEAPMEHRPRQR